MATINVQNAPERARYEALVGGELAGFAEYDEVGDRLIFTHTEVAPDFEGNGIGSALVRGALDDVRTRGLRAVPVCTFMQGWLARHEGEYEDVVLDPAAS
ncbi:GNAT family N-acetyltransferase [Georgenia sp. AZ-5]|uniref:GNAT family N-acetyltransferase n=1 Tax=Georgenia sp. AZ-5 TaxID=3367526 RepID=UPI00375489E2